MVDYLIKQKVVLSEEQEQGILAIKNQLRTDIENLEKKGNFLEKIKKLINDAKIAESQILNIQVIDSIEN